MDGGSKVMPETKDLVKHNMKGIAGILNDADADVCFLQEVDIVPNDLITSTKKLTTKKHWV